MAEPTTTSDRVTEFGAPELIDPEHHVVAVVVGVVLLVLVTVLGVVGLASLIDTGEERTQVAEVVVPRFADRTMLAAQAELERLGLIVDVRFEPNETVAPDMVVGQQPIAGARLEVGEQVTLIVSDGPAGVTVPDLSGIGAIEAQRTLGILGLGISLREIHDEEVPQGEVVRSDPAAGSRAQPGGTVTVAVSLGPEPRTVPDVVGRPAHEGFAAIGRAELEIAGVVERRVAAAQVGTVLSTDPPAGTDVPRDQPIRVVVGIAIGGVALPDVSGLTEDSARAVLANAGLRPVVRTEAIGSGDGRAGRVIRQSPVAGSATGVGDAVTITVGATPTATTTTAPPPPPPSPTPPPPPSPTPPPPPPVTPPADPGPPQGGPGPP